MAAPINTSSNTLQVPEEKTLRRQEGFYLKEYPRHQRQLSTSEIKILIEEEGHEEERLKAKKPDIKDISKKV